MRSVNAEFKDIRAGLWESLNSNCPSGAAAEADNVDFPAEGGVRSRAGFETLNLVTTGTPDFMGPVRYSNGDFALRVGSNGEYTSLQGWMSKNSLTPTGSVTGRGAFAALPLEDDIIFAHKGPLRFSGAREEASKVAYFEVEATAASTEYEVDAGVIKATYKSVATIDPSIKLDLSGVETTSGTFTQTQLVIRTDTRSWVEDEEYKDYLTTHSLPFQTYVYVLNNANTVDGLAGNLHLMGPLWNPKDNSPAIPENGLGGAGRSSGDGKGTWRPLIRKDGTLRDRVIEMEYHYNAYPPNPLYNLEVQKLQAEYNRKLAEHTQKVALETTRVYIANQIALGLKAAALVAGKPVSDISVLGTVVRVAGATAAVAQDTGAGNLVRATFQTTDSVGNLPPRANEGDKVFVDKVLFTFKSGVWVESPAVDVSFSNEALSRGKANGYLKAGDATVFDIRPPKAGVYDYLKDIIGDHTPVALDSRGGRLVLTTDRGVFVSAIGAPLDFFPSSSLTTNPSDGFFLNVVTSTYDRIRASLLVEDRLLLATNRRCYLVRLGSASDTVLSRLEVQGPGQDSSVFLVSTVLGPLMVTQDEARGFMKFSLFQASPEGTRYTSIPYVQQMLSDKERTYRATAVTSNTRGTSVCVGFNNGTCWLIDISETPRVRTYSGRGTGWIGYVEDTLTSITTFNNSTYQVKAQREGTSVDMPESGIPQARITFHAPPEWRSYAPDSRYTFKQAAAWVNYGPITLAAGGVVRSFDGKDYNANIPVHLHGERQVTVATSDGTRHTSGPWHIKAVQYTLLVRNGKTPASW